ncbi:MAG: hypothetical protein JWN50_391 [Parcubacteria group bacterium]|nr:hypothetical protein [Parcubacteria group bacterium]
MKARQVLRQLFSESAIDIDQRVNDQQIVTKCLAGHLNGYPDIHLEFETLRGEYECYQMNVFVGDKLVYGLMAGDLECDDEPVPYVKAECFYENEGEEIFAPHTPEGLALLQLLLRFAELAQNTIPTE